MGIEVDKNSIGNVVMNLKKYDEKVKAGLLAITKVVAKNMESWAKQNAKWNDQTGDARRKLLATANFETYSKLVVNMSHRVPYGPMLELAHERKYAILEKAINQYKDEFVAEWIKIVTGVK